MSLAANSRRGATLLKPVCRAHFAASDVSFLARSRPHIPVSVLTPVSPISRSDFLFEVFCLRRSYLGFAVFGKQIVERFGDEAVKRLAVLHGKNLKLIPHLLRKVDRNGARCPPALLLRSFRL